MTIERVPGLQNELDLTHVLPIRNQVPEDVINAKKISEYDQEIPQLHIIAVDLGRKATKPTKPTNNYTLQTNPWHREEEPQNIYSNMTSVRQ